MSLAPRRLDDRVSVSPQISEEDIAEARRRGFKTIINNRPDHEEPGQLTAGRAAEIARAEGLDYVHIPFTGATLGPDVLAAFAAALDEHPGPVLAHCRSGTRCSQVWALTEAQRGTLDVDDILRRAGEAGYDLGGMRPLLTHLASQQG